MKAQPGPIVVFGGTGHYGQKIVANLALREVPVRVLSRNRDKARELLGDQVEIIEGDVCFHSTIVHALEGCTAVIICLSAFNPRQIRQLQAIEGDAVLMILEEMQKAGIRRLIYLSVYEIREALLDQLRIRKLAEVKLSVEQGIRQSGLDWAILGCPPSYELFFALLQSQRLVVPGGGRRKIACVSRDDVGAIAAQAALMPELKGQRIHLCGPEALSFPEFAARVSGYQNQNIKVMAIPLFLLNIVSRIAKPFNPFLRFLYYSLKMMNHFPEDLAQSVPADHGRLLEQFDYHPVSMEDEIEKRLAT